MQFSNSSYYSAMDEMSGAKVISPLEPVPEDRYGDPVIPDEALNFTAKDIGITTNPMGNTLESLKGRIREGTGRIEFSFMGQHKGNSQNPTPESFGQLERQDMRELLKVNEMKSSTHAAVHANSLAGFTNRGFNDETRAEAINEIKKAIQFAGEATKGGAIVFHIHEWQRPMSHIKDRSGAKFAGYQEEDQDAVLFAVDDRTGELVSTISKNKEVFRPVYQTAADVNRTGQKDENGNILNANDWVDLRGNKISRDAPSERLFDRVPIFDKDKTNFKVQPLNWEGIQQEAAEYNKAHPNDPKTPEEMFAILQIENKVLQAKGASLYHARLYESEKYTRDRLLDEYNLYKKMKESVGKDEEWKLRQWQSKYIDKRPDESYEQAYDRAIKMQENGMRHTHESSSSADVQAREAEEMIEHIKSAEKYGLTKAADTIARTAIYAMQTYEKNKQKYGLEDPLYVAPENWSTKHYGSHPEEYRKVIDESRAKMVDLLMKTPSRNGQVCTKKEAEELAKTHIRGTLDIGHLNTFRENFIAKNPEKTAQEFDKWMLDQAESLVKEGYVGHVHMSDNYGFDDEHLTPGQGNVPFKEFLKRMDKLGMKDMIVESGSFNVNSAMLDTLALVNSPVYGVGRKIRFGDVRNQQFGYNSPGFFIAGSYAPSNDWKPWTDIPLE
jgi:sugar phosphate isomerase/epimerase